MSKILNPEKIKKDFPILERVINGNKLVYLDNGATTQKPKQVVEAISEYYLNHNANVNRGVHTLSDESTELYETARQKVATFIGARKTTEIIVTKNSTEALNLVAGGWGLRNLNRGDIILISSHEHNSNILPWNEVAKTTGAIVETFDIDEDDFQTLSQLRARLSKKDVKVFVFSHASNVLGNISPVKEICTIAKENDVVSVVDGSQAVPHLPINVISLGCDFYAFSSHKMLGPMGVGILYGRERLLEVMSPINFGGGMVLNFDLENPTWQKVPERFEAGTPDVAGLVGLGVAIDYLSKLGMDVIRSHEIKLSTYLIEKLSRIKNLHILGTLDPEKRCGLVSFHIDGIHSHDIAAVMNANGVAVRSGMHCAMYLHKKLSIPASTRISYYLYNSKEDLDKALVSLEKCIKILG